MQIKIILENFMKCQNNLYCNFLSLLIPFLTQSLKIFLNL